MKTIRELRVEAGMKQIDLARKLGANPVTVLNWERRMSEPTATMLRKVASIFDVSMDDIEFERTQKRRRLG